MYQFTAEFLINTQIDEALMKVLDDFSYDIKIPYYAKLTCFPAVIYASTLSRKYERNEKGPSVASFLCSTVQKVCL